MDNNLAISRISRLFGTHYFRRFSISHYTVISLFTLLQFRLALVCKRFSSYTSVLYIGNVLNKWHQHVSICEVKKLYHFASVVNFCGYWKKKRKNWNRQNLVNHGTMFTTIPRRKHINLNERKPFPTETITKCTYS